MIVFAERFKFLRNRESESQNDLAEQFNVTQSMISKWEKGKFLPEASKLIEIAEYFQVSTDYLLGLTATSNESRAAKVNMENSLTDEEKEIIDMYRKLPPDLKRVIFATEKQFAQEQEDKFDYFTSKIKK